MIMKKIQTTSCVWMAAVLCLQLVGLQVTRAMTLLPEVPIGDPLNRISDAPGLPLSTSELEDEVFGIGGVGVFRDSSTGFSDEGRGDATTLAGLFEGDIVVNTEAELRNLLQENKVGRSAINGEEKLWRGGIVPYVISASFDARERKLIGKAFKSFHRKTCVRFVPRSNSQRDYIYIYKGDGCSSSVGRQGGKQGLSIGWGCHYHGIILHELMHAVGFWHEQSRFDRDRHVIIHWDNIEPAQRYNFNKHESGPTTSLGLAYDYSSLMHYNSHAFALDLSRPTIEPRKRGFTLGQRKDFSKLDLSGLNLLYSCPSSGGSRPVPTSKPTTISSSCKDNHPQCSAWTAKGECKRHKTIMDEHCAKSCNSCRNKKQLTMLTFPSF